MDEDTPKKKTKKSLRRFTALDKAGRVYRAEADNPTDALRTIAKQFEARKLNFPRNMQGFREIV
jgi:hypothetical protein